MEAKRNKQKANKFPRTALAFYIKLYCKQKGSSETKYQSNLIEATKSWLSLSDLEKQQVSKKHKECENKFKLQCFDQLKNAEPFMKVKDARLKNVDLNTSILAIQEPEAHIEEDGPQQETEHTKEIENNEEITLNSEEELVTEIEPLHDQDLQNEIIIEPIDTNENTSKTCLVEPLPPTLKAGKDLFHMLHSTDEENNISWTSLPQLERNQYNRAVFLLKKDYISKYREYLESLTPKELFDYYNKTFF